MVLCSTFTEADKWSMIELEVEKMDITEYRSKRAGTAVFGCFTKSGPQQLDSIVEV